MNERHTYTSITLDDLIGLGHSVDIKALSLTGLGLGPAGALPTAPGTRRGSCPLCPSCSYATG